MRRCCAFFGFVVMGYCFLAFVQMRCFQDMSLCECVFVAESDGLVSFNRLSPVFVRELQTLKLWTVERRFRAAFSMLLSMTWTYRSSRPVSLPFLKAALYLYLLFLLRAQNESARVIYSMSLGVVMLSFHRCIVITCQTTALD